MRCCPGETPNITADIYMDGCGTERIAMKKISIVVPCYNEQEVLPLFYIEIQKVMQQIQEEHADT